jgi:hypothetical protein
LTGTNIGHSVQEASPFFWIRYRVDQMASICVLFCYWVVVYLRRGEGKIYPKEDGGAQAGALLWQRGQKVEAWCGAANAPLLIDGPASLFFKMNDADDGDNSGHLTVTSTPK